MSRSFHRSPIVDTDFIDRSNVFVEAMSPTWRAPMKISIEEILKPVHKPKKYNIKDDIDHETITVDPSTHKIKVNFPPINVESPNVFSEPFNNHNISYYQPPINASRVPSMHLVTDGNYLYVWVGNRWKRSVLSEWD